MLKPTDSTELHILHFAFFWLLAGCLWAAEHSGYASVISVICFVSKRKVADVEPSGGDARAREKDDFILELAIN